MPDQLAELLHAQYAAASLSMAMFHHHRTGEGQQVGVDLFRTSWWSVAGVLPYLMGDPSYDRARLGFAGVANGRDWWRRQMPFISSYRTKDGAWVMVTPSNLPQLLKHLSLLGIKGRCLLRLVGSICADFVRRTPGRMLAWSARGLSSMQPAIQQAVGRLTLAEFRALGTPTEAQKAQGRPELYWCPVLAASNVIECAQPFAIDGMRIEPGGAIRIMSPVQRSDPTQL